VPIGRVDRRDSKMFRQNNGLANAVTAAVASLPHARLATCRRADVARRPALGWNAAVGIGRLRRHNMIEHQRQGDNEMNGGNGRMRVDVRKGIRTFFDIDGITIAFWGSSWNGREVVTVDDRVVSKKWSLRYVTEHHFECNGIRYKLVFRVLSLLRGEFRVELYREGDLVDTDFHKMNAGGTGLGVDPDTGQFSGWVLAKQLGPYFVIGMAAGAGAAWLVEQLSGA
jgi:hypothetical protein